METVKLDGKIRMRSICSNEECTSCMACYAACPVGAIRIEKDEKGFYRPVIDSRTCIGCRRCVAVCPAHGRLRKMQPRKAIAAYVRNKELRAASTSGGAFSAAAAQILSEGGVVFGAAFDAHWVVRHQYVEKIEDLGKLRVSKYVQSYVGDSFSQAKQFLDMGRRVFFTGTPCQINGLKNFLGKEYENLVTADIVCHGVPSAQIFEDYLKHIEEIYSEQIQGIRFRYKTREYKHSGNECLHNMKIMLCNGTQYIKKVNEDPYLLAFFSNLCLNPACYSCPFATKERPGDLTMADFWGFRAPSIDWVDTGKGISLVLLNSEKGERLFEKAASSLKWCERPMEEAIEGNPHLSCPIHKMEKYEEFWKDYRMHGYEFVEKKYFAPIPPANANDSVMVRIKKSIPPHLKWILKKMCGKI